MIDPGFFSAFAYSLEKTMTSMLGTPCWVSATTAPTSGSYISGIVYLTGRVQGRVALTFPKATAQHVVGEMLGVDPAAISERLLRDGVGEMINIVAGNAKALLADTQYAFHISLPRVACGDSMVPGSERTDRSLNRQFESPSGILFLGVWLAEESTASKQGN